VFPVRDLSPRKRLLFLCVATALPASMNRALFSRPRYSHSPGWARPAGSGCGTARERLLWSTGKVVFADFLALLFFILLTPRMNYVFFPLRLITRGRSSCAAVPAALPALLLSCPVFDYARGSEMRIDGT